MRSKIYKGIQEWADKYSVSFSAHEYNDLVCIIEKLIKEHQEPCPDCPVLRGEDARRFLEQMETAKYRPTGPRPVPNIEKAKALAIKRLKEKTSGE